jgi:hypothetical protein
MSNSLSSPGQPKALDDDKQKTVCSLVAAGVSLRQVARFVDCDPKSIRREAQRNDDFRRRLAKAKSEASVHPLQTLQQAAKADWRAALSWMERIDPDRFARPNESKVTKYEANRFVDKLVEVLEEAVKDPCQRQDLFDLLGATLPAAMRRRWEGGAMDRAMDQVKKDIEERNSERQYRESGLRIDRNLRRRGLFQEMAQYLPPEMQSRLWKNHDLLDPEEVFAQEPEAGDCRDAAPAESCQAE